MNTNYYLLCTIIALTLCNTVRAKGSDTYLHLDGHMKGNKNGFFLGAEVGGNLPVESFDLIPYISFSITPFSKSTLVKTGPYEYYQLEKVSTIFDLGIRQEFNIQDNATFFLKAGMGVDGGYYKGTKRDFPTELLFQSEGGFSFVLPDVGDFSRITFGGGIRANQQITYPTFTLSFSWGI